MRKYDLAPDAVTLVDLLRYRAKQNTDKTAYIFLVDGEMDEQRISYGQLDQRARAVGAWLQEQDLSGERALLLFPPGLEYIANFFGCLYAGVTAVPAYPPRLNRPMPRLRGIAEDAQATVALTTPKVIESVERRFDHEPDLKKLRWVSSEDIPEHQEQSWVEPDIGPETLAFLQYTSGSTSAPKGVMLSHGNLMHNLEQIRYGFREGLDSDAMGVFWLPSYHDMGLIGGILEPMYVNGPSTLMGPADFLQRPFRWLDAISRYRATISGAPNFAYELCVERITPEQRETLDLSSWVVAFSGAEPVRPATLERFADTFGPQGFDPQAFYPCYGLAEGSLIVTGGVGPGDYTSIQVDKKTLAEDRVEAASNEAEGQEMVSCGRALLDQEVVIVQPESRQKLGENEVGEIWVSGPNVAQGYWNRAEQSAETFGARIAETDEGPFMRTGDLGFLREGELFITGRLKDLLIIRGRNHYPQDIELSVEQSHPALQADAGAAFSVEVEGEEKLVVVQEVERKQRNADIEEVLPQVRRALAENHELRLHALVLIRPMSIQRTSSGKIQRHKCKQTFLEGGLKVVAEWRADEQEIVETPKPATVEVTTRRKKSGAALSIEAWLLTQIATKAKLQPSQIDVREPFVYYGLDSAQAVELAGELEEWLERPVSPTLAWDYPTVEALAAHLAGEEAESVPPITQASKHAPNNEPIAIVGMGCRFPGADSPEAFWELLREGVDAIAEVPAERWSLAEYYAEEEGAEGKMNTRWGAFLADIDQFDPAFFGISPREATRMDPQQRILLEVSWEALEHANLPPERLAGSQTGVFMGISSYDYSHFQYQDPTQIDAYAGTGNAHSIAANRLSYVFDLRGPSMAVDTACSSSLVSVHMACQSLRSGETNLALAGGVNLILAPELTITFSQARMMAADGRCKTFDARADGYVRGEGCGMVVLKRLSDAERDGDNILAMIRGTAVNQDGRSNGLTAPNGPAQQAVIRQALENAGARPAELSYVETHGTGTPLGDPIEVQSLRNVLEADPELDHEVVIGSVKTNVGHLEAAAGIAGLMKVVLALQHEAIPPHLHLQEINPYLNLNDSKLTIGTELRPWQQIEGTRLAGISSFGFGGTNAHVIIEEKPQPVEANKKEADEGLAERPLHLVTLSAREDTSLNALALKYADFLQDRAREKLADLAYTANTSRSHHEQRLAIAASTTEELQEKLEAYAQNSAAAGLTRGQALPNQVPKIAFLFTGQGAQYAGMGAELYKSNKVFRQALDRCATILTERLEMPLLDVLYPQNEDDARLHNTGYTQPALFALEYAVAQVWASWGIQPDFVMGHSVGEYVAACIAGVFSLEDGLRLIAERGRLMAELPLNGGMAAVFAGEGRVAGLIAPHADKISVAALNGPQNTVISGEKEALKSILVQLESEGIEARSLSVSHAFHSPLMEPMLDEFAAFANSIEVRPPRIPLVSNLFGEVLEHEFVPDASYWKKHVRQTVNFAAVMQALERLGSGIFLEIGPKPTLLGMGRACLPDSKASWLPSLKQKNGDWQQMLNSLGGLYVRGAAVDWEAFDQGHTRKKVRLPSYAFNRQRYWLDTKPAKTGEAPQRLITQLLGTREEGASAFEASIRADILEELPNSTYKTIAPTTMISVAQAAAEQVYESRYRLSEVAIQNPLLVEAGAEVVLRTELRRYSSGEVHFTLSSAGQNASDSEGGQLLANGTLRSQDLKQEIPMRAVGEGAGASADGAPNGALSREKLLEMEAGARQNAAGEYVHAQVARVLQQDPAALSPEQKLDTLGLDSLMAIELKNSFEGDIEVNLPIVNLLEGPSIAGLTEQILELLERPVSDIPLVPLGDDGGLQPLTLDQQAMWFLDQLMPDGNSFNVSGAVKLIGAFDEEAFRRALEGMMRRHPSLRTTFTVTAEGPMQQVQEQVELPLFEFEAAEWTEEAIRKHIEQDVFRSFDLENEPAFRVNLYHRSEQERVLLVAMQHVITDFWSMTVFASELAALYQAEKEGQFSPLPSIPLRYSDYVRWEEKRLESAEGERMWDYWREKLAGDLPELNIPTDRPREPIQSYHGDVRFITLRKELTQALKELGKAHGATLYTTLLAGFQVLLQRYSGQDDLLIGSAMSGRTHPDLENLIGYFINPVALRGDLSGNPSFIQVLEQARQTVLEAVDNQDFPPPLLAQRLGFKRDPSRPPIFQTTFIYQKTQIPALRNLTAFALGMAGTQIQLEGLKVESIELRDIPSQFDMTLMMAETDEDQLSAALIHNSALFEAETIERMLAHFQTLLEGIVANPQAPIAEIPLLNEAERRRLLFDWNDSKVEYPTEDTLQSLFEAQAARSAEAIALSYAGEDLTYAELNQRANQLAHYLRKLDVGPETMVGLFMERSLEMVIGIYGILKAGGAYVPLDPDYPAERISLMLEDTQVPVLLTQSHLADALAPNGAQVIQLDIEWEALAAESDENPEALAKPENLAYVIYTSGSTGRPKGVMNEHRGIVNSLFWMQDEYQLGPEDLVMLKTPYSFDVSLWEFFWPLQVGARLVIAKPGGHMDSDYLIDLIEDAEISTMVFVPSQLQIFLQDEGVERCTSLKRVLCIGEALPYELTERFFERLPETELHNLYGPTEAAVEVTYWACEPENDRQMVPIGRPVANTQMYILGESMQPVPVGVPGELHIGGVQVARGYHNRPELNAEKFIPDPFSEDPEARLYKTGDLARYLPDKTIDFLGRVDFQVKVRGFRIELGEIEARLLQHPNVREAVVVAKEMDAATDRRLVAYLVPKTGETRPAVNELRAFLKDTLPEYMLPATIVSIEAMPLNTAGKINRRALPEPPRERPELHEEYVAPRNTQEAEVALLCAEILELEQVGVLDNFFDLGGDSLMATRLIFQIQEQYQVKLPLIKLFEDPTVAGLSEAINAARQGGFDQGGLLASMTIDELNAEAQIDTEIGSNGKVYEHNPEPEHVLLTGSTGFVGAYLLRALLDKTSATVYCLVRAKDQQAGLNRIQKNLSFYALWEEGFGDRVTPLLGDLAKKKMGLGEAEYEQLSESLDVIFHNGASVNFAYPYRALKGPNVEGTHEVLKLASLHKIKPVHFVSSLAVFLTDGMREGLTFKEDIDLDTLGASYGGYGQSKRVAEKMVMNAFNLGIPVTIHRPDNVSGDTHSGIWNTDDMAYTLLKACLTLGTLPEVDFVVGLVPVDFVANAILHNAMQVENFGKAFHLTSRQQFNITELADLVMRLGYDISKVPLEKWQEDLYHLALKYPEEGYHAFWQLMNEVDLNQVSMPKLDMSNTLSGIEGSDIQLPQINTDLLGVYFKYFEDRGLMEMVPSSENESDKGS